MAGVRRWKRERDDDAAADKYEFNDGSDVESRDGDRSERLEDLSDLAPRFEVLTLSKKAWAPHAPYLGLLLSTRHSLKEGTSLPVCLGSCSLGRVSWSLLRPLGNPSSHYTSAVALRSTACRQMHSGHAFPQARRVAASFLFLAQRC